VLNSTCFEALLDFVVMTSTPRRVDDDRIIDTDYHEKMRVLYLIDMKSVLSVSSPEGDTKEIDTKKIDTKEIDTREIETKVCERII
jgi:hypothetical protein